MGENPKTENRSPKQNQITKLTRLQTPFEHFPLLKIVSDFEIRTSDFPPLLMHDLGVLHQMHVIGLRLFQCFDCVAR
jgi:hypothetical protein